MTQPATVDDEEVFDIAALAAFLKVSERTVEDWDRAGSGPVRASLPGRTRRWLRSDVLAWLKPSGDAGDLRRAGTALIGAASGKYKQHAASLALVASDAIRHGMTLDEVADTAGLPADQVQQIINDYPRYPAGPAPGAYAAGR